MNQGNEKPPKFLYRYLPMDEYTICIFRDNKLHFRNPNKFNDPFDCRALLTSERDLSEEEYAKFLMTCERDSKRRELTCGEKESCKRDAREQFGNTDKKRLMSRINDIIKEELPKSISEFRVLCLSENYNDILMWSHYADGHGGLVLQFDREALSKNFRLFKVCYPPDKSYPSIKDFNERGGTHVFLITKASQWIYEKEWRILMHIEKGDNREGDGKVYKIEKGLITGIILGCAMQPPKEEKIRRWIHEYQSQPITSIYKAIKDEGFYNIKTDPEINEYN
jgi:hypothetical protein